MLTTKELPENERPYEKCEKLGCAYLSDTELLAVILRCGTKNQKAVDLAHQILKLAASVSEVTGLYGINYLTGEQLKRIHGIGRVKAIQIQCVLELSRRLSKAKAHLGLECTDPETIAGYYMEDMRYLRQEQLILLMLNTKNHMICDAVISKGCADYAVISPRDIFIEAMRREAVNIILIHNHPSGDPTPSSADIDVTKKVARAGELIGIRLLDHIIIGDRTFSSLRSLGWL